MENFQGLPALNETNVAYFVVVLGCLESEAKEVLSDFGIPLMIPTSNEDQEVCCGAVRQFRVPEHKRREGDLFIGIDLICVQPQSAEEFYELLKRAQQIKGELGDCKVQIQLLGHAMVLGRGGSALVSLPGEDILLDSNVHDLVGCDTSIFDVSTCFMGLTRDTSFINLSKQIFLSLQVLWNNFAGIFDLFSNVFHDVNQFIERVLYEKPGLANLRMEKKLKWRHHLKSTGEIYRPEYGEKPIDYETLENLVTSNPSETTLFAFAIALVPSLFNALVNPNAVVSNLVDAPLRPAYHFFEEVQATVDNKEGSTNPAIEKLLSFLEVKLWNENTIGHVKFSKIISDTIEEHSSVSRDDIRTHIQEALFGSDTTKFIEKVLEAKESNQPKNYIVFAVRKSDHDVSRNTGSEILSKFHSLSRKYNIIYVGDICVSEVRKGDICHGQHWKNRKSWVETLSEVDSTIAFHEMSMARLQLWIMLYIRIKYDSNVAVGSWSGLMDVLTLAGFRCIRLFTDPVPPGGDRIENLCKACGLQYEFFHHSKQPTSREYDALEAMVEKPL